MEGITAIVQLFGAFLTGVVGPIVIWWLKNYYKSDDEEVEEEEETIDGSVEFAQNISEELEQIRKEISADRVWIAQFHNGGKLLGSVRNASMKRISIVHEVTGAGVSKEERNFSEILVSLFSKMISRIMEEEYVRYTNDSIEVDPEAKVLFRQRGTQAMHLFAMRNINGVLIGIMGIDYVESERELDEDEIQYLKAKANLLAGYIFYGDT